MIWWVCSLTWEGLQVCEDQVKTGQFSALHLGDGSQVNLHESSNMEWLKKQIQAQGWQDTEPWRSEACHTSENQVIARLSSGVSHTW